MCNLNPPRVVVEDLMTIDLRNSETVMVQHLNDKNSPIGVGMCVTDKFRFFTEGERHFGTFFLVPKLYIITRLYPQQHE